MSIRSGLDRIESVQVEIIKLLRKQREAEGQAVLGIDDIVEPRERVEAFPLDVARQVEIFQAGNIVTDETVLETLKEKELVLFDGSTDGDARRRGANPENVTITQTRPRQSSRHQVAQLVTAGSRFDRCDCAGELSVLGRIGI